MCVDSSRRLLASVKMPDFPSLSRLDRELSHVMGKQRSSDLFAGRGNRLRPCFVGTEQLVQCAPALINALVSIAQSLLSGAGRLALGSCVK